MANERAQSSRQPWGVENKGEFNEDPLLDCLVLLTKHHQRPFTADALGAGLPLEENRLTPELFSRAAARAGLSSKLVKRPLNKISNLLLPAVLLLEERQACLLLGIDRARAVARVAFPESGDGESEIELGALTQIYTGYAIFVQAEHRFDERTQEVFDLRGRHWFWGTIAQSWRIYRDVLVASFLINIFALASPLFVMNVYDRVVPNNALDTLWVLATGVVVVYVFDLLMRFLRGYFIDSAGRKADVVLSAMIFQKVLGIKMEARPVSVGSFANNLREFDSIRDFITSATITTVIDLPFVLLFIAVIWFIGGPVAYIPIVAIPMVVIYGRIIQGPLRKAVEQVFRTASEKNATLVESLTALETVKAIGAESRLQGKWERAIAHLAHWGMRSRLLSQSAVNLAIFLQQVSTVGVVVLGVYLIGEGELSMGGLIACVILTGRAMVPMAQVANLSAREYQARAALQSLDGIMKLPVERPHGKTFLHRPELEGSVEFQEVCFSYPHQETRALDRVSFRIATGEKVAVIGRIGSGKTTVQKLAMGLYEPVDGAVRIGGTDVRQIDPADLRKHIGYIPQDVLLFFGTLRENIALGSPYADDEAVLRAAEIAGVTEFANRHPQGFDMTIGERGEGLSGGQRQAVAVARALLNEPSILLMDEPSNSMDNASEQQFKQGLSTYLKGKTLILVTHRAALLELVDRVIVVDQGRVVADGPKTQVLTALKLGKLKVSR